MRTSLLSVSLLVVTLAACKSTGCSPECEPQAVVERVAKENPTVTRLTVHCTPANGTAPIACASTSADKKGKPSDPEDLKAMQTGAPVVLEEAGALDVTVPIMAKDGKYTAACGVTVKVDGMNRDQVVAKAKEIAKAVEAGIGDCCSCCGK